MISVKKMKMKKLLKRLYRISSPSMNERKMKHFLIKWIAENVPSATISEDNFGNLYIEKGESDTFPCVVSHIDEVHESKGRGFVVVDARGTIFGYNTVRKDYTGIGADDKNGIWVCLNCLLKYDAIKVAFFVQEELGTVGSSNADVKWFSDCRYILECDRKGGTDLIVNGCNMNIASDEFVQDCGYGDFGYSECTFGGLTDVVTLSENGVGVSCVNIACGYYRPHTECEFTVFSELENCLNFVFYIIENCTKQYLHTASRETGSVLRFDGINHIGAKSQENQLFYDMYDEIEKLGSRFNLDEFYERTKETYFLLVRYNYDDIFCEVTGNSYEESNNL